MPRSDDDYPGLKRRKNRDGTVRLYWCARADLVKAGFRPETVRLHYGPDEMQLVSAACRRMQAEMLTWSADRSASRVTFDGTLRGLLNAYQVDHASPYRDLKWNTRRTYDHVLRLIDSAFGARNLSTLGIADFRRWYDEAKKPAKPGASERVRRAHGIIQMLRRLFAYGVTAELPECARLMAILDSARFKQPARRRERLELAHVEAFLPVAIKADRLSLALGTAIQFETGMRQRDVIGEWQPVGEGEEAGGIVLGGRRWVNGLTWADLSAELVVRKVTTKTGAIVAHDLKLCPLVMAMLEQVPEDRRLGPLIVDETAGRPYAEWAYGREWRAIARKAGVPNQVWNMDARAGAVTEAEDAGADLDEIRGAVGHAVASTTARYSRGALGKSRKVAELRAASRRPTKE